MADLIDPTQTGNYPVVLGDSILGKTSNDIFTGIRYNHKPSQSSGESSRPARLKPSIHGQTSSYDLSLADKDGRPEYAYAGARDTSDGQYVLYFDPDRKVFVLDRIDSTFNMNVTRVPGNTDPASLSRKYPHLESADSQGSGNTVAKPKEPEQASKPKPRAKSPPRKKDAAANKPKPKVEKKKETKKAEPFTLALPKAAKDTPKPKPKPKARKLEEEEEEDEDDDGGLLLEYPGAEPKTQKKDFSPALTSLRRFDDFMDQRESEADDADGESEDEPEVVDFKLPSPVNNRDQGGANDHQSSQQSRYQEPDPMDEDDEEEEEDDDDQGHANHTGGADVGDSLEDDLEKDLEMAFEAEDNSWNGTPANQDVDESEISEED